MDYQEFVDRCRNMLAELDSDPAMFRQLKPVPNRKVWEIRDLVSYLICQRYLGVIEGYYSYTQLEWEKNSKTYLINFIPRLPTTFWGEMARDERQYYLYIKYYPKDNAPPRFEPTRLNESSSVFCHTIIFHLGRNSIHPFVHGRSLIPETETYSDIAVAARIAKSASRFLVPIQDHEGQQIAILPIGMEELIFIEVLREAMRRRHLRNMEETT